MLETLHLQLHLAVLIYIVRLHNVHLGLALDAHLEFLATLFQLAVQIGNLVLLVKRLLLQRQRFLLHLDFLFLEVAAGLFPLQLILANGIDERVVGKDNDGVALVQKASFLGDDALHGARLAGVEQDGGDGMDDAFHIDIFGEGTFGGGDGLHAVGAEIDGAGREQQRDGIGHEGGERNAQRNGQAVFHIPGFGGKFDVHAVYI